MLETSWLRWVEIISLQTLRNTNVSSKLADKSIRLRPHRCSTSNRFKLKRRILNLSLDRSVFCPVASQYAGLSVTLRLNLYFVVATQTWSKLYQTYGHSKYPNSTTLSFSLPTVSLTSLQMMTSVRLSGWLARLPSKLKALNQLASRSTVCNKSSKLSKISVCTNTVVSASKAY